VRPEDTPGYIAFLEQRDRETSLLLWEPGERDLEVESLCSKISQADTLVLIRLVAEEEGRMVGFLVAHRGVIRRIQPRADFVVGVLRQAWGLGIDTALLDHFEFWAQEPGVTLRSAERVGAHSAVSIKFEQKPVLIEIPIIPLPSFHIPAFLRLHTAHR
jgi:GNAT superfamily N-acetyltransferase